MSQDTIHLERPTEVEFTNMWDAMKRMDEPLVIKGSADADNQLVEIIRKSLKAKQLPRASDRPFANLRRSHNGIGVINSWVPSTNKHVMTILSDETKCYDMATSPIKMMIPCLPGLAQLIVLFRWHTLPKKMTQHPCCGCISGAQEDRIHDNKAAVEIMDVEGSHFIVKERLYPRPPNPNIM